MSVQRLHILNPKELATLTEFLLYRHGDLGAVPVHPTGEHDDPVRPARPLQRHQVQAVPLGALQRQLVDVDHGRIVLHGGRVLVSAFDIRNSILGEKTTSPKYVTDSPSGPGQPFVDNEIQGGASGQRLGWVGLDLGCSTILMGSR